MGRGIQRVRTQFGLTVRGVLRIVVLVSYNAKSLDFGTKPYQHSSLLVVAVSAPKNVDRQDTGDAAAGTAMHVHRYNKLDRLRVAGLGRGAD
ncbi:uncharacterized protein TrAtP1_008790 [Trichoderma atroviride]|uniref:uncharacterized protein n=1 Tax=Hypocrea atroviridis TaxID=63577 RepID=UPI00331BA817|nr:hypothetical protein TrAtP1_008790 [Trichoderma atroviride]